jgi:hypothetical protein
MMGPEIFSAVGAMALVWITPAVALPFLYIYLLQDFQGRRAGTRDPLLGTKILLTFLMTIGCQLGLAGLALLATSVVGDGGAFARKTGLGMMLGGAITGAFPAFVYLTRIGMGTGERIGHTALGLNAVITGLVSTMFVTVTSIAVFHSESLAESAAVAVIYLAATIGAILRLLHSPVPPAHAPPQA